MEEYVSRFKALGDPLRLKILNLLPLEQRCEDMYNVSELSQELGVSQPTVSHHLKILKDAGLVNCARTCRDVYYWIDRQVLEDCSRALGDGTFCRPPRKTVKGKRK